MNFWKTEKEELEKGCGEVFNNLLCGVSYDSRIKPTKFIYCQRCQDKLSLLEKCEDARNKELDEIKDQIDIFMDLSPDRVSLLKKLWKIKHGDEMQKDYLSTNNSDTDEVNRVFVKGKKEVTNE